MCGIVGLFLKNESMRPELGRMFGPMLSEMASRGPDSAGVAIYRDPAANGFHKYSLASDDPALDWHTISASCAETTSGQCSIRPIDTHAVLETNASHDSVLDWLQSKQPDIRLVGSGDVLEIFKEVGSPDDVYSRFELEQAAGSHMIGHTRMATESAVTTAGSHPFATGQDLCLVHNGSLSNHNRLRDRLIKEGLTFQTENDTEVAAAYMTWKLSEGKTIEEALDDGLSELDGFYTFCIGTKEGFTVIRDPIACKHAVLAESDDWVAMATEYRAIATLPGSDHATIWEPKPQTIYSWNATETAH